MSYSDVESVFCLTPDRRYKQFFKIASESEQVWGFKDKKGWITIKDEDNNITMPVWPSYEYAKYCQENQWKEAQIEGIDLFEFLEYWLDGMKRDGCRVLVLADSEGTGVSVEADKFKRELAEHLSEQR
jgi:hypothetical protein